MRTLFVKRYDKSDSWIMRFVILLIWVTGGMAALNGAVITAISGGLVGLAIGASTKTERWERVHLGIVMNCTESYQPQLSVRICLNRALRDQ